ncbi:MAG: hypothetical protein AAGH92_10410, partial [Planctomycetota bacterium]
MPEGRRRSDIEGERKSLRDTRRASRCFACAQWAFLSIAWIALLTPCVGLAQTYEATDTPFVASDGPPDPTEYTETFAAVGWTPEAFDVWVGGAADPAANPQVRPIRFPSPHPSEDASLATVTARWYIAQRPPDTAATEPLPAAVLVHTLHPQTPLTELIATSIARRGVHAVIVDLPGYGLRSTLPRQPANDDWPGIVAIQQAARGVAEVRRACDAVAALPGIDPDRLVLQGGSLGSFPAAIAAGLDARSRALVLLLSGGDVIDVIEHGQKDAAKFRAALESRGIDADERARLIAHLEPLRVAHRLNPQTTWLLGARNDTVIPAANARALADAIGLDETRY